MSPSALRATLLTPYGRGAVAVVRVWGPNATTIVDRMFRPAAGGSLEAFAIERIVFGRWHGAVAADSADAPPAEELVVCRRAVDDLEIHCHGGTAASTAILAALEAAGCAIVPWAEWSASSTTDLVRVEANIALAEAKTSRTAGILLDQQAGALRRAVEGIIATLLSNEAGAARSLLAALLARAPLGRHLVAPFRVVLTGRPNVGKSSLINALVGYDRSIVYDRPGTTRDVVTAGAVFAGWPVELSDTAGLHTSFDPLEQAGMSAARRRLSEADLIVAVFDASVPWSADDDALCREHPSAVVVHNKLDRATAETENRPAGLSLSAVTKQGLDELIALLTARLVPEALAPGMAVPFTERQTMLLATATEALTEDRGDEARSLLEQVFGGAPP
ncbi:MAG: 50S ribosome-binding GTPase [Planctomycetia bacterium]|nr:50S ribosome-binding GTPase [Planctomycetia bacterium]